MPKIVDPIQRRQDLAQAVWRVIRRDGLEHASVRNIAREAGLSMGSLRNTFGTQAELLLFAMTMVVDRIERRMDALVPIGDPRVDAERFLTELLPLDDERREEHEVWVAFTARALVDSALRERSDHSYDAMRAGCRYWVETLAGDRVDIEWETDRLFALLDGLAMHISMRPDHTTPELARAVLAGHLDELAGRPHPTERTPPVGNPDVDKHVRTRRRRSGSPSSPPCTN